MSPRSRPATPEPDEGALLRRTRRLDLIGRIADDLVHEIRNPLNALVINLEVLRRRAASGDTAAVLDRAGVLDADVRRLERLVGGLLRLVRPPRDDAAATDPDALVDELTPLLEHMAGCARVELSVRAGRGGARLEVPPDALRFALLYLAEGAFRSLPHGGAVDLAIDHSDATVDARFTIRSHSDPSAFDTAFRRVAGEAIGAAHDLVAAHGGEVRSTAPGDAAGASVLLRWHRAGSA